MLFWLETVGFTCQNEDQRKSEDALVDQNPTKTHSFLVHHHHHQYLLQRRDEALKGDMGIYRSCFKENQWPSKSS